MGGCVCVARNGGPHGCGHTSFMYTILSARNVIAKKTFPSQNAKLHEMLRCSHRLWTLDNGQWSSATQVSRARHKQQMLEQSLRPLVKRPKIVVCHITGKYCVETPWDPWGNFPPTKNYTRKIEIIKRRFFSVTNC